MRMTMQVLCLFMEMLTRACYEAFVTVVKRKGATATNSKMMPRQHIDSGSSWRYRCKRSGRERVMQGWWGAPEFRVPTGRWHGKRGTCKDNSITVQNSSISYNTQAFVHMRSSRGYTFEACIFGAVRVRSGVE